MLINLIGLGSSGKTTCGKILARKLNLDYIDLDHYFEIKNGPIYKIIKNEGYLSYSRKNVRLFIQLKQKYKENAVYILSSGFMFYDDKIFSRYSNVKEQIIKNPYTILLMPSKDLHECVDIIVERQMKRSTLLTKKEEIAKIHERYFKFIELAAITVYSNDSPGKIVNKIIIQINKKKE
jgi:shikimate kinase